MLPNQQTLAGCLGRLFRAKCCNASVLQDDRRRGGVGNRDVVVAVHLRDPPGQRAAHRHPIEELHPLRPRLLDPVMDGVAGKRLRIVHDLVQAKLIELLVDESGPLGAAWSDLALRLARDVTPWLG
jgi:hypothetical protein